jgi:hypothetical protein
MATQGTLVRSVLTLSVLLNDGDGTRHQVTQPLTRRGEKVFLCGLNRPSYRGISYRLMSGILGLYPMGVKREPKVKCITYHCVNVGNVIVGLDEQKTGLAAAEVTIAWQSRRSSPSRKTVRHMAKDGSHCKEEQQGRERTKTYVRYHQNPTKPRNQHRLSSSNSCGKNYAYRNFDLYLYGASTFLNPMANSVHWGFLP